MTRNSQSLSDFASARQIPVEVVNTIASCVSDGIDLKFVRSGPIFVTVHWSAVCGVLVPTPAVGHRTPQGRAPGIRLFSGSAVLYLVRDLYYLPLGHLERSTRQKVEGTLR
ncbi:BZ3500_MvSof-1268-A1-R1_Chr3-1g05543 [Microbotryum saponariae]|uniref:BZ3500_MvSof-1268-A1-R1_Chr3-1g05543 protein n=1 Tax=Microbotryum saponariae TaxID=289078 RepID=A0A2X0LCM5_9BASI|nr:BZ3500_MvSof-1268-A1-R1_Chr3-1g05543 [Microbotryum saponariae]SDA04734.1 BZ3501_MvSof-1269-A2-R1_Chr3-1g05214 [Microbotryum saponariae]